MGEQVEQAAQPIEPRQVGEPLVRVDGVARGGLAVEVDDLAAVGQTTVGADHGATLSPHVILCAVILGDSAPGDEKSSAPG